nr:hypothetical protein [Tanacetum cinerariifolium]
MAALLYKDDHNKVAYLEKGKGWEAYEQILDFFNRSHIQYALTHRPPIMFDSLVKQFWATATVRTLEAGLSKIITTIAGNEVVVTESLIRTQLQLNDKNGFYEFTLHDVLDGIREFDYPTDGSLTFYKAKLSPQWRFLIHILIHCMSPKSKGGINSLVPLPLPRFVCPLDGPHMPLLAPMLMVPTGGDGADAAAAGANEVPPPPPPPDESHTCERAHTSEGAHTSPVREPTTFWEPTPKPPTPPSPPLRPVEPWPTSPTTPFNTTTSTRPPSLTRQTSFQEDISEGGGDFVSSPKSNEAPPTTAAIAAGGAEDSAALTDLSLKLDRCINRVTTLENELGGTKKVLGGSVLKLVLRVKRLEGLLQQRKRRMVLSDSEGEEAATKEKDIDLDALHKLASTYLGGDTTVEAAYTIYKASQDAHASSDAGHAEDAVHDDTIMPFRHTRTKRRRLRKTFTSSAFEHFHENISAVEDTIPAGDGIPAAAQTIPAGSTPIPTIGGVSAGSSMDPTGQVVAVSPSLSVIPAADKGKAPMVDDFIPADLLTEQERVLKNLHDYQLGEDLAKKLQAEKEAEFAWQQEELAQKAQAKGVASPAEHGTGLPAQHRRELDLLGDDVNEDNINERLGMLLIRKRRELAEQSWVKPMNKTQQRDFIRDFVKNQSASVYNQGVPPAVHAASSQVPAASLQVPAGVPAASSIAADVSVSTVSAHADTEVHADESHPDDNKTASEQVSAEHTVSTSTTVTANESDGDPSAYAPYAGWEIFPTPFSSIHAYYDMEEHTKHFTSLRKLLHMVEKNDLRRLLGDVDKFYQKQEPETFGLILCGDLRVLFQSLADEDAHAFWRNQESWCIRSWCLYPYAQVHVLETVDGQVIYIFVDVSYPLSKATLKRMLKHGLEAPKLLVGGDLTMAEQLVSFIKAAILNAQSAV